VRGQPEQPDQREQPDLLERQVAMVLPEQLVVQVVKVLLALPGQQEQPDQRGQLERQAVRGQPEVKE
jgi:hypothetical protein